MKNSLKMLFALALMIVNLPIARADDPAMRAAWFKQLEESRFQVRINWIRWKLRRYDMSCVIESKNPELVKRFSLAHMDVNGNKLLVEQGRPVMLSNESDRTRFIGVFVDGEFLAAANVEHGSVGFSRNRELKTWDSFSEAIGYMDSTSLVGYRTHSEIIFNEMKDHRIVGDGVSVTCTADLNMAGVIPF